MSRGCRPAPAAAWPRHQLPLVPRSGPGARLSERLRPRRGAPARPGRARGSAGAAPGHVPGLGAAAQPRAGGERGKEAPGAVGVGMLELWVGRPRREAPARPGLRVLPGTAPSPGAADSQPKKAVRLSRPAPFPQRQPGGVARWTAAAAGSGQRRDALRLVWSRSRSSGPGKAPARFPAVRAGLLPPLPADHGGRQSEGRHPAVLPRRARKPGRGHPQDGEGSSLARHPGAAVALLPHLFSRPRNEKSSEENKMVGRM
ncbi:translation initiation factor IF-2-like isoform X2 [Motacilla alba alba]|uniref:translation initiation factor IF-2-like isoform X1 n=1 Tax=Motacilla alba alba TaxID=1094192 RepID=UPI0018D52DC7|nr:translation initiation factor IF-2-like isoform X1 [Motacilla alba alba]XP_037988981.1 translation initiation factor IF-2-like isoform X2 [Motacilla alba alba]